MSGLKPHASTENVLVESRLSVINEFCIVRQKKPHSHYRVIAPLPSRVVICPHIQPRSLQGKLAILSAQLEQADAAGAPEVPRERSVKIKLTIKKTYFENKNNTILKIKDLAAKIK